MGRLDELRSRRSIDFGAAERRLFDSFGLEPSSRSIALDRLNSSIRVHEVGDGPAILFVHGTMTTGACWADLAAELTDFRCVLIDRPGCGLSDPLSTTPTTLAEREHVGDVLLVDVLDALDIDTAHVVSNSLGGWYAFRSVAAHPERFGRIVGMGFQVGARIEHAPWFMRVQAPPGLANRIPISRGMVKRMLSTAGMRAAIESGRFNELMLDFMVALLADTDTMRNEMSSAPRPVNLRGPVGATRHSNDLLARVTAPTHLFWGTDDPFGGEDVATEFVGSLPDATLEMVDDAGHAPWIDQLDMAATAVRRHLSDGV